MARVTLPFVVDEHLFLQHRGEDNAPAIHVESQEWYAWLIGEQNKSFSFKSCNGGFTARRERQRNGLYWYAYRKRDKKILKTYLGKSEELTAERLYAAAAILSSRGVTPASPPVPLQPRLATKFSAPALPGCLVARPHISRRVDEIINTKLLLVATPAGWGKTTLLSTWYNEHRSTMAIAWITLDRDDNDPLEFWHNVITALQIVQPGVADPFTPGLQVDDALLRTLLSSLAHLPADTVLILDDYQNIEAQAIHQTLTFLLERLPQRLHLIIASRSDPPLPLTRLRVQGSALELRSNDLRFTSQEVQTFLEKRVGDLITQKDCQYLEEQTEGWAAGLHLATLSIHSHKDSSEAIASFSGNNRYITDYFTEEIILQQPEEVQHFLIRTSILACMHGSLCNALLERDDSQEMLERLEHLNLFVFAQDDERCRYRYHRLFKQVLYNRLRHTQFEQGLRQRASRWYEKQGLISAALEHALAISDSSSIVRIFAEHATAIVTRSQAQKVLTWLNIVPEVLINTHTSLCLIHARALMYSGNREQSEQRLRMVEACIESNNIPQARIIKGQIAAIRADMAACAGDALQSASHARYALDLLPESEVSTRAQATIHTALVNYLLHSDVTSSTEKQINTALTNAGIFEEGLARQAQIKLLQGRPTDAAAIFTQMGQESQQTAGIELAVYDSGMGELLREQNKLENAETHLKRAIALIKEGVQIAADEVASTYTSLVLLQLAQRDQREAMNTIDEFIQIAYQRHFIAPFIDYASSLRARIKLAMGDIAGAIHWSQTCRLAPDNNINIFRESEYLTLVRVHIVHERNDPDEYRLRKTLQLLKRLQEEAEARARLRSVIEILILRALALHAQGERAEAFSTIIQALTLAEPGGYIRLFIDEGAAMAGLLRQAHVQHIMPGYIGLLLTALESDKGQSTSTNFDASTDIFTTREHEVLKLLLDGASTREIARYLVISEGTVKKHISNIYSKLGVQSRAQVMARILSRHIEVRPLATS